MNSLRKPKPIAPLHLLVMCLAFSATSPLLADAGVFTGNGQNLRQITSKSIHLVSIDVTIVEGRGPFLFDGGVAGMDRAEYECKFVLKSLSDKPETVQIGFPVDSQFAGGRESTTDAKAISSEWVSEYAFSARDETATYSVDFVSREPQKGPGEFGSVFVWKMEFAPNETRTLDVSYHIPISMGLGTTRKDEGAGSMDRGAFGMEQLDLTMMEMVGYITSTGSSWEGNVEKASFRVITAPFEKYISHRGVADEPSPDPDQAEKEYAHESPFPADHPWWFRELSPTGWKEIEGGVEWDYTDYKPKDPILISYYLTQLPQKPSEVDEFVERFLKRLGPNTVPRLELTRVRDVVLASYGKAPDDPATLDFVKAQRWYAPRKDFSMESLSVSQRQVVEKLNAKIKASAVR